MTSGLQPINSGIPVPVQGVTGGPGLPQGVASVDGSTGNVIISPPGNTFQLKKAATPQALQVYEYSNSNTDYSRISLNTQTNGPFQLAVETLPAGVIRDLQIGANGNFWRILGSTGEYRPDSDNLFDIGDATHRVHDLYIGGQVRGLTVSQIISAVGVTGGPSTTSTTGADIPEMTITFTPTGGRVLAFFGVNAFQTGTLGANLAGFQFNLDGTFIGQTVRTGMSNVAGQTFSVSIIHDFGVLTQISHIIKAIFYTSNAATTTNCNGTQREIIVVELR